MTEREPVKIHIIQLIIKNKHSMTNSLKVHAFRYLITQKSYCIESPRATDELSAICGFQDILIEIGDI